MRGKGRLFFFLGGLAVLAGCTSILGSFDSATIDDGGTSQDGAVPDTSVTPNPDGNTPGSDGSTPTDAGDSSTPPLSCDGGSVVCGTGPAAACANLDNSGDNCGACGHSCGGGTCANRKCGPAVIYTVPPPDAGVVIGPLGQDLNNVFFESNEDPSFKLLSCPKTGCTGAAATPHQVAVMPFSINGIHVPAPLTVAFVSAPQNTSGTERPAIFSCPTTGCPSPPVSFVGDGLNGVDPRLRSSNGILFGRTGGTGLFSTTCSGGSCTSPVSFFGTLTKGTHGFAGTAALVYFIDATTRGSNIARCAVGDTACTPISVVPGDQSTVEGLALSAGKLFWLFPGRVGFIEGKLMSCDLPACANVAPQAIGLDSPSNLSVDANGAYWLTASNKIQHCPANGCVGGQQDVIGSLDTPHDLLTDGTFVYWAERTKISRIAE